MGQLIFIILIAFSISAQCMTDYTCQNQCIAKGSLYQFCHAKCSADDSQGTQDTNLYNKGADPMNAFYKAQMAKQMQSQQQGR